MAPYSIPAGSSYQAEIPAALSNTQNVLLVLSEEAETSRWVQKEVGCAIGARHKLIPIRSYMYESSPQFSFLLDGEQIYDVDVSLDMESNCAQVADYLIKIIKPVGSGKQCGSDKKTNETISNKKSKGKQAQISIKDGILVGIGITIIIELWTIIRKLNRKG